MITRSHYYASLHQLLLYEVKSSESPLVIIKTEMFRHFQDDPQYQCRQGSEVPFNLVLPQNHYLLHHNKTKIAIYNVTTPLQDRIGLK